MKPVGARPDGRSSMTSGSRFANIEGRNWRCSLLCLSPVGTGSYRFSITAINPALNIGEIARQDGLLQGLYNDRSIPAI